MRLVDDIRRVQRLVGVEPDGVVGPETVRAILRALDDRDGQDGELFDARTERNLATLDPLARGAFRTFTALAKGTAAAMGCEYVAIAGHRSWEEQDALFARGRTAPGKVVTNARGGQSNHNFGIAVDYGVFREGRYLDEDDARAAERVHLACAVHAMGCGLEWGGDWKAIKDFPHYEVATGLTMAQKRERWRKSGSVLA